MLIFRFFLIKKWSSKITKKRSIQNTVWCWVVQNNVRNNSGLESTIIPFIPCVAVVMLTLSVFVFFVFFYHYDFKLTLNHTQSADKTLLFSCTAKKTKRGETGVNNKWSAWWLLSQDSSHSHTHTLTWKLTPPLSVRSLFLWSFTDTWLTVMRSGSDSFCVFAVCVLCVCVCAWKNQPPFSISFSLLVLGVLWAFGCEDA